MPRPHAPNMDDLVARIHHDDPNVAALRAEIAARVATGIDDLREYLGTWEKRYLGMALGSIAVNAGRNSSAWLLHAIAAFEKAFADPAAREEFVDPDADRLTYEVLREAAQVLAAAP